MGKYLKHFFNILKAIGFKSLTFCVKKEKNTWVFGAWKGTSYSDNSKYFYEYVNEFKPEINAVWITKQENICQALRKKGYKAVKYPSKEAFKYLAKAYYLIETEGNRDIGMYPVGRAKVIQLWHGIPAKKMAWHDDYSWLKKKLIDLEYGSHKKSIWISSSEYYSKILSETFKIHKKNFQILGHPRSDAAFLLQESDLIKEIKEKRNKCKIITYMPTHRNFGIDFDFEYIINGLNSIDNILEENNVVLVYKPHPNEIKLLYNYKYEWKNIIIPKEDTVEFVDAYSYIYMCDGLISDYSSIIYDYLIINRPIVLFNYDEANYCEKDAGICTEYYQYPVGPICKTWEQMINMMIQLLNNDVWVSKREDALKVFNPLCDGKCCERLYKFLRNEKEGIVK